MFSIRTIIWVTLVVFLLPSDEKGKQELYDKVHAAANMLGSACNQVSTCAEFDPSWNLFAKKAQNGVDIIAELINGSNNQELRQAASAKQPTDFTTTSSFPQNNNAENNTLEISDMIPAWRSPDQKSFASR